MTSTSAMHPGSSLNRSQVPAAPAPRSRQSANSIAPVDRTQHSDATAAAVLSDLQVKGRAPKTGYSRGQFGQAWTDDNEDPLGHNGCDTRNDILRRDLTSRTMKPDTSGCVVLTGRLADPYTGKLIGFRRGQATSAAVQIDHVVALGDAWQTGAQLLTAQGRIDLANDPLELLAVDGPTNESKGDGDAASWLPPNRAYRCAYIARQIAVKLHYHLWTTPAENAAFANVLDACPSQTVPVEAHDPVVSVVARSRPAVTPTSTHSSTSSPPPTRSYVPTPVPRSCTRSSSGKCIRGGAFCPQASYGQTGYDGNGNSYTCTGDRDRPHWE